MRSALGQEERCLAEVRMRDCLLSASFYEEAQDIYCYASFRDEADTCGIIEESLRRGKRVAVPKVTGKREMEFFFIDSMCRLHPGTWSIPEPGEGCVKAPRPGKHALVIVPGAAFDRSGRRIGYGGGYYDTYLEGNRECRIAALAFDVQCMAHVPSEEHDVRMEYIITEKELIVCSQDYPETRSYCWGSLTRS